MPPPARDAGDAPRASTGRSAEERPVTGTKRTRSPGCSRAGDAASGSNSTAGVVPISCQPPGVDRGYAPEKRPASATAPAGTRGRGRDRRGTS
ncbi:hypothetical protein AS96_00745 [Microbacterium sp. MRS-1]|nr:hypothetical protein AS96_00745 [Microbacterium sp. MRS-1]